jgi:preprotein translocase subunit SecG
MLDFFFYLTMVLFLVVCGFLILLVLIQKGRGGGLASAFGGAGGNTAFGSKTGDVLTWATSILFGVFLVLAVALNLLATAKHEDRIGPAAAVGTTGSSLPQPPSTPEPGIPPERDRADRGATTAPAQAALDARAGTATPTTALSTAPTTQP